MSELGDEDLINLNTEMCFIKYTYFYTSTF